MKDLIYRDDALNFDMEIELEEGEDIESICKGAQLVMQHIRTVPNARAKVDFDFVNWVAKEIFRENFDADVFIELACRKLCKLGIVKKRNGEWVYEGED